MVFTSLCIASEADVKVATHIPGQENFRCDELSRLGDSKKSIKTVMANMGLGESNILNLVGCDYIQELIKADV